MWISRKRYNAIMDELKATREGRGMLVDHVNNNSENIQRLIAQVERLKDEFARLRADPGTKELLEYEKIRADLINSNPGVAVWP